MVREKLAYDLNKNKLFFPEIQTLNQSPIQKGPCFGFWMFKFEFSKKWNISFNLESGLG